MIVNCVNKVMERGRKRELEEEYGCHLYFTLGSFEYIIRLAAQDGVFCSLEHNDGDGIHIHYEPPYGLGCEGMCAC
jgi:hypothetical protein